MRALACSLVLALVLGFAYGVALPALRGGAQRAERGAVAAATRAQVRRVEGGHATAAGALAEGGAPRSKSALVRLAPDLVAYVGETGEPRGPRAPVVVYLHGVHGRPENGCPWMHATGGWLLCPRADLVHEGGTASWSGSRTSDVLARATRAAGAPATVLVGFSQGAYEVDALLRRHAVRARGIVLLAADVAPEAEALRAAGVRRIALGAGELDPSFAVLRASAARLARDGIEVRLVSLGGVGHVYIADDPSVLRDAIRWVAEA
jgi:predicted esterase